MDLIVDIGNSRAHLALYRGATLVGRCDVPHGDPDTHEQFDQLLLGQDAPTRFAMASVNAPGRAGVEAWAKARLGIAPRVLLETLPDPSPFPVDVSTGVGADRVANAIWALNAYPGETVVVVNLGTAITFNVMSAEGAFLGGAIAAGLRTSARALKLLTDQLPEVTFERDDWPPPALGQTTLDCIEGGLVWSAVGLVEVGCKRLAEELGTPIRVVATGGDAERIAPLCPVVERVIPEATLEGVRLALVAAEGDGPCE
jgi:type III pantothenate kinase